MDISITAPAFPPAPPATLKGVGFGRIFTDRMFAADFSPEKGWHDARIVPLSNISLHPACCVFHYGAEVFEGLKAYRTEDGGIQLFRPLDNGRRLWNSCERMGLPQLPPEDFVEAVRTFVREEAPWVPGEANTSLYLRPFVFCTDVQLGVHGIRNASFYIIASPVGSYYPHGWPRSTSPSNGRTCGRSGAVPATPSAAAITPQPPGPPSKRKRQGTTRFCGWTAWSGGTLKKWGP